MRNVETLVEFVRAENREGVEYITFGAIALMAHGIVRATDEADFFIAPTVDNIERLKKAVHSIWDDPGIDEIRAEELMGDYPSVRYRPPADDLSIDFLTRRGGAFSYETLDWQLADLDGEPLRVVTPAQLYRMKRDTVRQKDKIAAEALRVEFSLSEG